MRHDEVAWATCRWINRPACQMSAPLTWDDVIFSSSINTNNYDVICVFVQTDMAKVLDLVEKGADEIEKRGFLEKIDQLEELISDLNKGKQEETDRAKQLEKEVKNLRGKLAQSEEAARKLVEEYMTYREQEIAQLKRDNEELATTSELEWRYVHVFNYICTV